MAYDAGSVVFKFEADTTQIDKALQDVKSAAQNIGKSGSGNSKKNQLFENLGLSSVSEFRQTYNWLNQITKASRTYTNMISSGLDPSNHADILSYQNQISQSMSNNVNYSQLLNGNFSSLSGGAAAAGTAIAGITAYITLAKKGLTTCVKTIKTINSVITTTLSVATKIVTSVGDIVYKISGLKTTVNSLKSIFQSLSESIAETFSVDNIETFIEECVDLGSQLTEVQNVVDTIFGDNASEIESWASTATESLGMAETSAKKYSSTFGAILTSAGVSSDKITEMSTSLTSLTADMASLYNYDYDEMFEKIKSGLSGMVRPLASLGVSLHASTLQDYLDSKGINATYTELSYANKEIVRYNYLIENTTAAQGDFTKTFYTWANQVRYFKEQLTELMTTLGQIFISVLNPILIYVNKIFKLVNSLLSSLSTTLQNLFGDGENSLSNSIASVDTSDVLDDMESDVEDVNDAVKRTVSSFDELHKLNDDSSSTTSIDDLDLSSLLDTDYTSQYEDEEQKIEDWVTSIKNLIIDAWNTGNAYNLGEMVAEWLNGIIDDIYNFLDKLTPLIAKIAKLFASFINGFVETFDWEKLGETIALFIKNIQVFLLELINNIHWDSIGTAFADFIIGLFTIDDTDQKSIITRGFEVIKSAINGLIEAVRSFIDEMDENGEWLSIATQIGDGINSLFSPDGIDWATLGANIRDLFIRIMTVIAGTVETINWEGVGKSIGNMLSNLFSEDANGDTIFSKASTALANLLNGLVNALTELLSTPGLLTKIKEGISVFFENLKNQLDENDTWGKLFTDYVKISEIIKTFYSNAVKSVDWYTVITIAVDILSDLIASGIKILLATTLVLIAAALESILKLLIDLLELLAIPIEGLIDNVIGLVSTLRDWLEELFYDFFDTTIPEIEQHLSELWTNIKEGAEALWTNIKELWSKIKTGFSEAKTWITDKFTSIKTSLFSILSAIKTKLTSAWSWLKTNIFDKISSGVKTMLNTVISTINSLISKLNSISFTMPDWLGGGTFGLSIPTLPLLAEGGYIGANMPTPVVVGDNKTEGEIVAPESKIQENVAIALEPYMSKIESLLTALINSEDEIHVHLEMDGDEITEVVLNNANLATARGGA